MIPQSTTLRFAFAVLALLGQLTPAVAIPAFVALRPATNKAHGGCAPGSCACLVIEKATKGCCCSTPEPAPEPKPATKKRKACCSEEHAAPVEAAKPVVPASTATLTSAGKCSCDHSTATATAEPAISQAVELPLRWFVGLSVPYAPVTNESHVSVSQPPQPPPPKV